MNAPFSIPYQGEDHKRKLLHWASGYDHCVFLDSCGSDIDKFGKYDFILGVGRKGNTMMAESWTEMQEQEGWQFGIFTYDLKNTLEPILQSRNQAAVGFPDLYFFNPEIVIYKERGLDTLFMHSRNPDFPPSFPVELDDAEPLFSGFTGFRSNFSSQAYKATIQKLRDHIRAGDCYEINLTQNFTAIIDLPSPVRLYEKLVALSPVPFAAYARIGDIHLLCASPERFLKNDSGRILTQPIKGTISRGQNKMEDETQKEKLKTSIKEQAENVMIVDLSRNDLHRSCEVGSVIVPELFEVQTFPQVHHLVSTVMGQKRAEVSSLEAFSNTFPPGSMTGAPKIRTCMLIDQYELVSRGIYSGSIGYFNPDGDFDLNIIIRSLIYDAATGVLSYHVGGAITWDSDADAEYEETLLKAKAIQQLFEKGIG